MLAAGYRWEKCLERSSELSCLRSGDLELRQIVALLRVVATFFGMTPTGLSTVALGVYFYDFFFFTGFTKFSAGVIALLSVSFISGG